MKQLKLETGGRPFANDDLVTLQRELTDAVQAQFLGKGPFILSGCLVSGPAAAATVSAGIVCLNGQLLRFAGQSGVALPAQFQAEAVVLSDQRPYQTSGTRFCMMEVPAVLVASDPTYTAGEFLPLDSWGGLRWEDVVRASVRRLGEVLPVGAAGYVAGDYDATGLGRPGTSAWGWGLCNGQGGREDLMGRVSVGLDPNRSDYDTVGKQGGAETHVLSTSEMPRHTHQATVRQVGNDAGALYGVFAGQQNGAGNRTATATVSEVGSSDAHENRMPFSTLVMRQWVGY